MVQVGLAGEEGECHQQWEFDQAHCGGRAPLRQPVLAVDLWAH